MRHRTPIFVVASPRPRVGKTLVARVLIEYFRWQRRPVSAFDVNPDEFALVDRLPAYTTAASIKDTAGEVALFDQLVGADGVAKVVDLGHTLFDCFFAVAQQIDFMAEAQRQKIAPMVLFLADSDDRARQGYAMLSDRFPELALVPVFNLAVPNVLRGRDRFMPTARGGNAVVVPALSAVLHSIIERPGFSFLVYVARTSDTTTELYRWIQQMFLALRDLEVRLLLDELAPTLRRSA